MFQLIYRCLIRRCIKKTVPTSKNYSSNHKKKQLKPNHKHTDVLSSFESEIEQKSRSISNSIPKKSKNDPKISKKDANYHQVETVGAKAKKAPKLRGNIPPPPPLPTKSSMNRVVRNLKGR